MQHKYYIKKIKITGIKSNRVHTLVSPLAAEYCFRASRIFKTFENLKHIYVHTWIRGAQNEGSPETHQTITALSYRWVQGVHQFGSQKSLYAVYLI